MNENEGLLYQFFEGLCSRRFVPVVKKGQKTKTGLKSNAVLYRCGLGNTCAK